MALYKPVGTQAPTGGAISRSRSAPRNTPSKADPGMAASGNLKTLLANAARPAPRAKTKGRAPSQRPNTRRHVPGMGRGTVQPTRPPQRATVPPQFQGSGNLNAAY